MATTLKGKAGNDTLTGGDDVIIGFGSSSLTVDELPNVDSSATTAKVTLNADTTSYTANSSMLTIDGGLVSGAIEIVGNAKANKIFAGDFGSTLNGGGNDVISTASATKTRFKSKANSRRRLSAKTFRLKSARLPTQLR